MDAISFVLGIKSSHLRSAHLKDLVYRGRVLKTSKINDDGSAAPTTNGHVNGDGEGSDEESQSLRPGRNDPKSAWVMAVYEDDTGEEQKWKRSITNQGASEYRINDRVVTAQDYNNKLEEENILIKARNFLVFQGDVEAIASQSPKDLTRLIEQISGSLEYKADYERLEEEAAQAAEHQTYNLHRRRAINSEIKQYQEQKKEAEAFQTKVDERDTAIVTQILYKLYHFQRTIDESKDSIKEHQENLKEYRRGVEKYEKSLEAARQDQTKVSKEVAKVERNIKRKEKEVEDKENSLIPIDEKVDHTTKEIVKIRKRIDAVSKERDLQAGEVEKDKKELVKVEKAQKQFEIQWQETLKKQGKQLSEADFKEYNSLRSQVVTRTSSTQSKLDNLIRQMKTEEVTVNSLKGKVETSQASVEKVQGEVNAVNERRESTKLSVKDLSKEIDSRKKEFNRIQSERVRTNQKHTELEEKLQEILKALLVADEGRRQNEKETRNREMVRSLKHLFPGVKGRIGDLCKPKQKKFEEAVITALGRDFESVIVDTEKTGTECVQYLKDQHHSPMTFIPLDNIKVNAPNANLKALARARLTIDTIDFDSALERAMSYACGSSIVCDDLETAKDICYKRRIEVKAVTLEGYVIHKAGLMTGGRGPEPKGGKRKFDDHHDTEALRIAADRVRAEIEALPKANRRGAAEETLQSELAGFEQRLTYAKSELAAFEKNLASKKKELDHEKRQLKEMQPRYEAKLSALEKLQGTVDEFKSAVAKVEDEVFANFCRRLGYSDIRAYEAQQGSLEREASEKRNAFELQKQTLTSQLAWEETRYKDTKSRLARLEDQISRLEQDIQTYEAEKITLENAMDIERAQITEMEDQLHKLREKLAAKNEKVTKERNELQKQSKEIESRNKEISGLETDLQKASAERYDLLRKCKLDQTAIPLTANSKKLDSLPVDQQLLGADPDAMDVDEGDEPEEVVKDYGIEVNFDELDDDLKNVCLPFRELIIILIVSSPTRTWSHNSKKESTILLPNWRNSIPTCAPLNDWTASKHVSKPPKKTSKTPAKPPRDPRTSSPQSKNCVSTSSTKPSSISPIKSPTCTRISLALRPSLSVAKPTSTLKTATRPIFPASSTTLCLLSSVSVTWNIFLVVRKRWLLLLCCSPSTLISQVHSSCLMKWMLRLIMRMWRRSRIISASMLARECNSLSFL
jgi:structural maintenance of chromosome 1